eukprot:CAMPEP_0177763638 /NCGR_PEP_ID=MMETSP0491_2-20121128/6975_1 /TAXON_ID=63592 /ORGANISM="Tetraselmis chuii, Strain PLY429" /LENGTH=211 /DNA_ID=CAMNT_0019279753 /DNA_START=182 /DNA_END=817 /DNA_ORIENTATION=+
MTRQSVLMNAALLLSALLSTATVLTSAASSTGFEAARIGDIEGMEAAMRDGLDIDAREEKSEQTMLMAASLAGQAKSVKWLLSKGADWTVGELGGFTPMHGAAFQGRDQVAKALLKAGVPADAGPPAKDGFHPIFRAVWGFGKRAGHLKFIKLMIEDGHVDINIKGPEGQSLLDSALEHEQNDVARYLLLAGIDPGEHDVEAIRGSKHSEL